MNKKIILVLMTFLLLVQSNIMPVEPEIEVQNVLNDEDKGLEKDIEPYTYGYYKLGSSIYFQNFGYGRRYWKYNNTRAYDYSFNAKFVFFSIRNDYVIPNFKYAYLKRKKENEYSGIGLELGAIARWTRGIQGWYPNIELIWGKEYTKQKGKPLFTQFSINLLPATCAVIGVGYGAALGGYSGGNGILLLVGLAAIPAIFEYTIAF